MAPVDRLRVGIEVVVAEILQACEHRIYLGFLVHESDNRLAVV